jgi:hypothetical protein
MAVKLNDVLVEDVPNSIKEDLIIENGDFKVFNSDQQHIQHILKANPGQYYQSPLVGLGIGTKRSASLSPAALRQLIKTQLKADDYQTNVIEVSEDFIVNIDASRLK